MDSKTINLLLNEKQLITKAQFDKSPYIPFSDEFCYYLNIHKGNKVFYASKPYCDEICKALEFYIKSAIESYRYSHEIEIENKLLLEPAILDRQLNLLYDELNDLKSNLLQREESGYTHKLKSHSRENMFYFIVKHFEKWATYWIKCKHIDFDGFDLIDSSHFHDELTNLGVIEKIKVVNENIERLSNLELDNNRTHEEDSHYTYKLTWCGTPAHLALVVDLLIEKGYLQQPTPFGERTAEQLLNMFNFTGHNPTKESLGKLLHKDRFPISDPTVIDRFQRIPHRSELKR
ncbi:hypothetical protein [Chitinophaga defluvii]|uniref:Uncharacterized protein n=1 Tax=Chitinophaga defluvii TaxID=3163343 RepID=A0ABV2TDG4_9BACT